MDTIFALSSGAPPAAIGVMRLSGPGAFDAVRALARGELPQPRRARLVSLRDPAEGALLDRALLLCFPGPASATGEDLAEFHLHGGRAVVRAVEAALARLPGLRPAEPGEFTRRALLNGRIDLSEAEGLGDLLAAETETQRRVAIRSAEGGLRRQVEAWAARALALSASVEAMLDHADEADVAGEGDLLEPVLGQAAALSAEIAAVAMRPPVERLRDGLQVVIAGPPNAGKSTLFNALAGREAAIVSPLAGTTRDRIEAPVMRDGLAFVLTDTAGLSEAPGDAVEEIGIGLAREAMAGADILLWLGDDAAPAGEGVIAIHSRADESGRVVAGDRLAISAVTGEGIEALWATIAGLARTMVPPADQLALNLRQRDLASRAAAALGDAAGERDPLLLAEQLRAALRAFDAITGRADVEAMLDALFARFCIGK
ncbi:tRNA uridine-5-carboxymethylaminomethyl(34) synthesis GTPase MnmE [Sphingomonas sp.]|uniref:tRNA uridine-5-carboxymethylaminomethyl(34) synthesis GTPase MnmE n=1 Tax=Sphingomonas sp. TaxID=28214 RepID=UPI001B1B5632|nr:tRNA uridine-5-carboxymethylaminomethyl(34) synthesis GTPase MnmE [Sphingomonas sp.]MBO9714734.1 tRNA uridine-5-carboxymethylaminomethyl(34) synthesis GTPase MnmE [Sphingomonas sp.]